MAVIQYITPTQPKGSDGGITSYKNGGQLCMRSRAYPLPNQSQAHIVPMNAIAILSMLWESPLTNADRIGWGNYAFATPLEDAYGNPIYVKGYAHFMRVNRPLLQHGLPLQLLPPASSGMPDFTPTGISLVNGTTTVKVTINPADTWANQTGANMMLWISRPRSKGKRYAPEVYKPLGVVPGDGTSPPAATHNFTNPWGVIKVPWVQWVRPSVVDGNGRLSSKTNDPTNPNPKIIGTKVDPVLPCSVGAVCTYNLALGTVTRGTNGLTCIPMPGSPFVNVNVTNVPGFFWVKNWTIGGISYGIKYQVSCPVVSGHLSAQLFFQTSTGSCSCTWLGTMDSFGNGNMTAQGPCPLPAIITVTQV